MAHFPRGQSVRGVVGSLAALALAVGALMQGALPAYAVPGGGNSQSATAGGYPSQQVLAPQQKTQMSQKEAAVTQWISGYQATVTTPRSNAIGPQCVVDPGTGQCVYWETDSVGGYYTIEPPDQPDWCGPGAGTAIAMHWNYNWVTGYGSYPAREPSRKPWNGNQSTYTGGQAWMAWFAQGMNLYQYGQSGVQPYPSTGTGTGQLADGIDDALGTSYYITLSPSSESSLFGNATYDIGHDGHPMSFLVNAQYLPEWSGYTSVRVNHFIEGYGYGWYSDASGDSSTNQIYYADSASQADGSGIAGDYSMTYDNFYNGPWRNGYQVIVV